MTKKFDTELAIEVMDVEGRPDHPARCSIGGYTCVYDDEKHAHLCNEGWRRCGAKKWKVWLKTTDALTLKLKGSPDLK